MAAEERLKAEFMVEPRPTLWTAIACDMMGQRSATIRRFDIAPPLLETDVDVERARRVLMDVFLRNGQTLVECFRAGSMMGENSTGLVLFGFRLVDKQVVVVVCIRPGEKLD